jgi:HTH-type transcriptional regulator/antitoxin HigA
MATLIAPIQDGKVPVTDLVVNNRRNNARALARVEELMSRRDRTSDEDALLEVLTNAIEAYESRKYARATSTPAELIRFLLEQNGQTPKDLWELLGGKSHTSEILSDKRPVGRKHAILLGKHFNISPVVFLTFR